MAYKENSDRGSRGKNDKDLLQMSIIEEEMESPQFRKSHKDDSSKSVRSVISSKILECRALAFSELAGEQIIPR